LDKIKEEYRLNDKYFTRNRILGFEEISMLILKNGKKTSQVNIDEFQEILGDEEMSYSKSAYTQARAKISHELFIDMNNQIVKDYYKDKDGIKLYKNFRIFAIDGSTLQLPDVEPIVNEKMDTTLKDYYGSAKNQYGEYATTARISMLEDTENNIIYHSLIDKYSSSERDMAMEHIAHLIESKKENTTIYNDLIIFDRGYPSYALITYMNYHKIDYLIRMPINLFNEIEEFRQSKLEDSIINLTLTKDNIYRLKKQYPKKIGKITENMAIGDIIQVRAIKVKLPNNEIEILITSLTDKREFKTKIFKNLYFKRWGIEEKYKSIKSLAQVENLTGITDLAIKQDFFATIVMSNICNLMINVTEEEKINEYNEKKIRKYKYKINRNYTWGTLKDEFIFLIVSNGDLDAFFEKTMKKISKNLIPIKPNRSFSRQKKMYKHKFPNSQKKAI
jgi:hypothetical protein